MKILGCGDVKAKVQMRFDLFPHKTQTDIGFRQTTLRFIDSQEKYQRKLIKLDHML
jgi:hypothetical protein